MGCDIHFYAERPVGDMWEEIPPPDQYPLGWYVDRNYVLFALLAGVRNNDQEPISEPRGLPKDVSPEVLAEAEHWGRDGHSHSWLTVDEALAGIETSKTEWLGSLPQALHAIKAIHHKSRVVFWFDD